MPAPKTRRGYSVAKWPATIAAQHAPEILNEKLAEQFGVDSVAYLPVENLRAVSGPDICAACFDGNYPVPVSGDEVSAIQVDRRG